MGVKQHLFICTFRISNWFVTGIKFWSDLDGKIVFTHYRILSCISFFKPRKPKHSQMGQSGCQTTPFHLYIQNIKLVCDWNQVLVRPGWENRVTHYRILSCLAFSNLGDQNILRWDKVGIKQLLFICTFRVSNWFVTGIKFWSDRNGKIMFTPYRILSCISFFKPRRPKHSQMNIKLH